MDKWKNISKSREEQWPDEREFSQAPFSFLCLIALALKNSITGSLSASDMDEFICEYFPYYPPPPKGLKNSLLSKEKYFEIVREPVDSNSQRRLGLYKLNSAIVNKMDKKVQNEIKKKCTVIKKTMRNPLILESLQRGEEKFKPVDNNTFTSSSVEPTTSPQVLPPSNHQKLIQPITNTASTAISINTTTSPQVLPPSNHQKHIQQITSSTSPQVLPPNNHQKHIQQINTTTSPQVLPPNNHQKHIQQITNAPSTAISINTTPITASPRQAIERSDCVIHKDEFILPEESSVNEISLIAKQLDVLENESTMRTDSLVQHPVQSGQGINLMSFVTVEGEVVPGHGSAQDKHSGADGAPCAALDETIATVAVTEPQSHSEFGLTTRPDDTEAIATLEAIFPDTSFNKLQHLLDATGGDIQKVSNIILLEQTQQTNRNREFNNANSEVEVERLESQRTLAHVGFQEGNTPQNKHILCDLARQPLRCTDDNDLSLGPSESPTANYIEKKRFGKSSNQDNISSTDTTQEYSYSPALNKQEYSYSPALNKHDGTHYVGLLNQAMTCYLNSFLQTLFMTPEFRNALYHWEFKGTKDEASKNIPCQLQRLFLQLQTSKRRAIRTTNLTRSFGWDSSEAWQQHDIQELCRVMFDALQECFKDTDQSDLIKSLYEGKIKDYIKCLNCDYEEMREDTYLDVPLPIRSFGGTNVYKSVEEAFKAFVKTELLTGSNQYKCPSCNTFSDAHKGLKFTCFPYLLTIHLMRINFDYTTFRKIKLNDKVTFPNILDLNSFIDDTSKPLSTDTNKTDATSTTDSGSALDAEDKSVKNASTSTTDSGSALDAEDKSVKNASTFQSESDIQDRPFVYELYSIMVHSGSAAGGHYYAYIKDLTTGEWFCFNDQSVTKITDDDIKKTYGGGNSRSYYSSSSSSTNAYMLMYRQINKERNVCSLSKDKLPKHIANLMERMNNLSGKPPISSLGQLVPGLF